MSSIDLPDEQPKKRYIFLRVLCIWSALINIYGVSHALISLSTFSSYEHVTAKVHEVSTHAELVTPDVVHQVNEGYVSVTSWVYFLHHFTLYSSLLVLLGVILMIFRLKWGFLSFLLGKLMLLYTLVMLYILSGEIPYVGFLVKFVAVVVILFSLLFIALFAAQLKNMRWRVSRGGTQKITDVVE